MSSVLFRMSSFFRCVFLRFFLLHCWAVAFFLLLVCQRWLGFAGEAVLAYLHEFGSRALEGATKKRFATLESPAHNLVGLVFCALNGEPRTFDVCLGVVLLAALADEEDHFA